MLNMFKLSVVMLSIIVLSVAMVSGVIQIMVRHTVIMLSVAMNGDFKLCHYAVIIMQVNTVLSAIVLRPSVMVPTLNTFFFCRNKTFSYL
jgi:hypothetical protein